MMNNNETEVVLENVIFGITEEEAESSKIVEEEVDENVSSESK